MPAGSEVATKRGDGEDAVAFSTTEELAIPSCSLTAVATVGAGRGDQPDDRTDDLERSDPFPCFSTQPAPNDVLMFGLSVPVPRCAVALRLECQVEGVGVDPRQPPLVWEAWTGRRWEACELEKDGTGGLNRPGDVVLHVPAGHTTSLAGQSSAAWVRCRVVQPAPNQPFYSASPRIHAASAFTIGGTIDAAYSETVRGEVLGLSEGVPGQRFPLARRPVLAAEPIVVEVAAGPGWQEWTQVSHFGNSGPSDTHFLLDPVAGEIVFGPGVRQQDGLVRLYGAIPPKAAPLRVRSYRVGGGKRGNVARGTITALRASVPFVARIENRRGATGGVDGEDIETAKLRAPLELRTRDRAVTASDYAYLAQRADRRIARAHCTSADGEPGVVRVLVVPTAPEPSSTPLQESVFIPSQAVLQRVAGYLDERRLIGTRLVVEPPGYQWITAVATGRLATGADARRVRSDALQAMYRFLHPLRGGQDESGWEFGRPVLAGELLAVIAKVPGIAVVEEVKLYPADRRTGQRDDGWSSKIDLAGNVLPFSYEHHIELVT